MLVLNDPAAQISSETAAAPVASLSAFASTNDLVVKVCRVLSHDSCPPSVCSLFFYVSYDVVYAIDAANYRIGGYVVAETALARVQYSSRS